MHREDRLMIHETMEPNVTLLTTPGHTVAVRSH
jgi:hypothetical protein